MTDDYRGAVWLFLLHAHDCACRLPYMPVVKLKATQTLMYLMLDAAESKVRFSAGLQ